MSSLWHPLRFFFDDAVLRSIFYNTRLHDILLHQIFSPKTSEPRHLQPSSTIVLEVACNKNHNGVE